MKKETLYLDTSVPSAYYDTRAEERQESTIRFWEEVLPHYQICISTITIEELQTTKDEVLRRNFRRLVKGFNILRPNKKIRELANVYVHKRIFPERYVDDALYVAIATFYKVPYLVSWNFEHLVKVKLPATSCGASVTKQSGTAPERDTRLRQGFGAVTSRSVPPASCGASARRRVRTRRLVNSVNALEGFGGIEIVSPQEL